MSLLNFVSIHRLTGSRDDDSADRASHLYTVSLLVIFTILVSSAQYVGDPIQCWCPAHFTGAYVSYTKNVCWISNTYYIPLQTPIPESVEYRRSRELSYYQWVPIIFLFMALMFKIPNMMWRLLSRQSGLDLDKLTTMSEGTQMSKSEEREKTLLQMARYIDRWLKSQRQYHYNFFVRIRQYASNLFCFCWARREGRFLTGFYMFIKLLYVVNVIGQFFILNGFLSMDFNVYGFEVMKILMENGELNESPRFPRITLCDFDIRQMQNVQSYTVQCVLPINLFNEKIFIFLWFWLFVVAIVACGSYISWLYYILFEGNRYRYAKKYLIMHGHLEKGVDTKLARKFANEYLRDDGIFVLRVVGKNSSELVLGDLVSYLWRIYKENPIQSKEKPAHYTKKDLLNGHAKRAMNRHEDTTEMV